MSFIFNLLPFTSFCLYFIFLSAFYHVLLPPGLIHHSLTKENSTFFPPFPLFLRHFTSHTSACLYFVLPVPELRDFVGLALTSRVFKHVCFVF